MQAVTGKGFVTAQSGQRDLDAGSGTAREIKYVLIPSTDG